MKTVAVAVALLSVTTTPSLAISRINSLSVTCERAREAIHEQGAVIFRWTSPRGLPLYDRYVRNSRFCEANEYAEWKNIPTSDDKTCRVLNCQDIDNLDGTFIVPNHSL
jgi:hypothetical protein